MTDQFTPGWIPAGVEQFVENYSKPLLPAPRDAEEETDWESRHKEREARREEIRNRVRNADGSKAYFHKGMPLPSFTDGTEKKVSVYARVSTKSTDQTSSIENQELYYTKKIAENEHWKMTEIYKDEGKSGMEAKHRKDFQRMIADAKAGKMDLILCASVSRFARDITDCIRYITKLRTMNPKHPIDVYFETENIHTLDPNSEQVLHFHALLAHWESANKSRRMILSYDQRICTGQYPVLDLLGYRHTKDGQLIVHEEEAKTVKYVFLALAAGKSCQSIADDLTRMHRKTLKGKMIWSSNMVRNLTQNERRWGDLEARKTIVLDPRDKIIVKNNGIRDWAFVPGHHDGIISPELAKAAQYMASSCGRMQNGVPSLRVIDSGALKGFVNVCPRWRGINRETFLSACESVYSDENLQSLKKEIEIYQGWERNDTASMELNGYDVPYGILFLTSAMPALTISKKSVSFNKACHKKLGFCQWVEILYHPLTQTIALRESSPIGENAFRWTTESGTCCQGIETKAFSAAVYESLHWISAYRFRFRGITKERGGERIIFFSLDEPQILVGKYSKTVDDGTSRTRYIPYTTDAGNTSAKEENCIAFPKEWRGNVGLRYMFREKRNEVMASVTADDIRRVGVEIENPLIGAIPKREQILQELDELLLSM